MAFPNLPIQLPSRFTGHSEAQAATRETQKGAPTCLFSMYIKTTGTDTKYETKHEIRKEEIRLTEYGPKSWEHQGRQAAQDPLGHQVLLKTLASPSPPRRTRSLSASPCTSSKHMRSYALPSSANPRPRPRPPSPSSPTYPTSSTLSLSCLWDGVPLVVVPAEGATMKELI